MNLKSLLKNCFKNFFRYSHKYSKIISRNNITKYILRDLKELEKNNKMFDALFVGSGGALERLIKENFRCNLITIDVDIKRKPNYVMSVADMHFKNNKFDVIFIYEVLEHVDKPFEASNELFRVLKPGGTLLLSTPFIFGIHDGPYDYWRFTKYGLKNLFYKFREIEIKERSGFFLTISKLLVRLIICESYFHKLLGCIFSILFIFLLPLLNFIDNFLPNSISSGYYLKAKK